MADISPPAIAMLTIGLRNQVVLVTRRANYGGVVFDPANPLARVLCEIAGTKTVAASMIAILKRNDAIVEVTAHPAERL